MKSKLLKWAGVIALLLVVAMLITVPAVASVGEGALIGDPASGGTGSTDPNISISLNGEGSDAVNIILLMTVLTLLPSILIMMTCFTRIIIVFSLLRNALGLQQTPPNQVLIGLALFLSLFIMNPVITDINENAYKPYSEGTITSTQFLETAKVPIRDFMLKQTKTDDINMFLNISNHPRPETVEDYTMDVVIPAFITSELKRAFTIGFLLFIPFLIIDMVVSSALMSMGMMMLPPVTVSMPFKLMLFVVVDGWGLLIKMLVSTYNP